MLLPFIIASNFYQAIFISNGIIRYWQLIGEVILIPLSALTLLQLNRVAKGEITPKPPPQPARRKLYAPWSIIALVEGIEVYWVIIRLLTLYDAVTLASAQTAVSVLYTWQITRNENRHGDTHAN